MIRAIHFPDKQAFREARVPGSVHFTPGAAGAELHMWFFCPCGCGLQGCIRVGHGFKPASDGASWNWDGNAGSATLHPSVNQVGHWHGWLRNGYWESC